MEDRVVSYVLEASYHPSGALLDQKLPDAPGAATTAWTGVYSYDVGGRVSGFGSSVTGVEYNIFSQPTRTTYANGVEDLRSYDGQRAWLTEIDLRDGTATRLDRMQYTRSATGIVQKFVDHTRNRSFSTQSAELAVLLLDVEQPGQAVFTSFSDCCLKDRHRQG